ncbi:hypothetical protein LX36DRAFT_10612 [Colletotrichum falcatum]|nr:hypothetical protein LX36DRAFT_10612 [Colletotrichum falcatum]
MMSLVTRRTGLDYARPTMPAVFIPSRVLFLFFYLALFFSLVLSPKNDHDIRDFPVWTAVWACGWHLGCIPTFEWRRVQSVSWRMDGGCHAASPADAWLQSTDT